MTREEKTEQQIARTELIANVELLRHNGTIDGYRSFVEAVGEYLRAEEEIEGRHGSE